MSEENNTLTTRVKALLDETKKLNERFERQISFLETLPQIFKQNSLFTKDCCCKQNHSPQLKEGGKNKEKIETSLFTHYKK